MSRSTGGRLGGWKRHCGVEENWEVNSELTGVPRLSYITVKKHREVLRFTTRGETDVKPGSGLQGFGAGYVSDQATEIRDQKPVSEFCRPAALRQRSSARYSVSRLRIE